MGAGIAQVVAQAGYDTVVYDVSQDFIDRGLGKIRNFLQGSRERGKISGEQEEQILGRLSGSLIMDDLGAAGLIIEAAPENLKLKREIFQRLDALCDSGTLLATNTSSLSVTAVATATKSPHRVLGLHFLNPPPLMGLVEVIKGEQTEPATIDKAVEIVKRFGKSPVCAKDTPGFVVNRIARPFYNEALRILDEGNASVETIDKVMREAGNFRMGPFQLIDLIGLDINFAATQSLFEAFFHDSRFRPSPTQRRMFLAGQLGRKTGRGFYDYGAK